MRKKAPAQKKKRGRPTDYKPEFCEQASRGCMLGSTNEALGTLLGVKVTTIKRWMQIYPDFKAAIKKGREIADQDVAISLYKRAVGYSHPDVHISNYLGEVTITKIVKHYPPDTAAAFIWLKNRRPDLWRDKITERGEGDENPAPIAVTVIVQDASCTAPS